MTIKDQKETDTNIVVQTEPDIPLQDVPMVEVDAVDAAVAQAAPAPTASQATIVRLTAPSNLSAGYQLPVMVNGQKRLVVIPTGGVVQGQTFEGALLDGVVAAGNTNNNNNLNANPHSIPHGSWRSGFCGCCDLGCCHPTLCLSCFCSPIALGQMLTRTNLNSCGRPTGARGKTTAFKVLLIAFIAYMIFETATSASTERYRHNERVSWFDYYQSGNQALTSAWLIGLEDDTPTWAVAVEYARLAIGLVYAIWMLVVFVRTRQFVRQKSNIDACCCPSWCNGGFEDFLAGFLCACCGVSQMARHTADYEMYRGDCCGPTGIQGGAPEAYPEQEVANSNSMVPVQTL